MASIPRNILNEAKYCSYCGNETASCSCGDQTITISISIPQNLLGGLAGLTRLIPKVQIASDRCSSCGHTNEKCTCASHS